MSSTIGVRDDKVDDSSVLNLDSYRIKGQTKKGVINVVMTADLNYVYNNNKTFCTNIWLWQIVFIQTWLRIISTDRQTRPKFLQIPNNHKDETDNDDGEDNYNDDEDEIIVTAILHFFLFTYIHTILHIEFEMKHIKGVWWKKIIK